MAIYSGWHYVLAGIISWLTLCPGWHYILPGSISSLALYPGWHYVLAVHISWLALYPVLGLLATPSNPPASLIHDTSPQIVRRHPLPTFTIVSREPSCVRCAVVSWYEYRTLLIFRHPHIPLPQRKVQLLS